MSRSALTAPLSALVLVTLTTALRSSQQLTLISHLPDYLAGKANDPHYRPEDLLTPPEILAPKGFGRIGNFRRPSRLVWGAPDDQTEAGVDEKLWPHLRVSDLRVVLIRRRTFKNGVDDYFAGPSDTILYSVEKRLTYLEEGCVKTDRDDQILAIYKADRIPSVIRYPWANGVPVFESIPSPSPSLRLPRLSIYQEMATLRLYKNRGWKGMGDPCPLCGLMPVSAVAKSQYPYSDIPAHVICQGHTAHEMHRSGILTTA